MFSRIKFAPAVPVLSHEAGTVFTLQPRQLGLGADLLIGGPSGLPYSVIDLSRLTTPVDIIWERPGCGAITDGADSIVFQDVEEIILPAWMAGSGDARIAAA